MENKKKTYKPKSKNVSLLANYLGAKGTSRGDLKKDISKSVTPQPKSRFYGNSSKY
jgi:hypothetical protein